MKTIWFDLKSQIRITNNRLQSNFRFELSSLINIFKSMIDYV